MRRKTSLLVSVVLVGLWLVTASPAGAATAKPASKAAVAAPARVAPVAASKPSRQSLASTVAKWWTGLKPPAKPKAAAVPALTIGVDNVNPAGHNWEYTAFFPETAANAVVHTGDTIDFSWNAGATPASLHTITFYNGSQTPGGT